MSACLSVSVCLSVRDHIFATTGTIFTKSSARITRLQCFDAVGWAAGSKGHPACKN